MKVLTDSLFLPLQFPLLSSTVNPQNNADIYKVRMGQPDIFKRRLKRSIGVRRRRYRPHVN